MTEPLTDEQQATLGDRLRELPDLCAWVDTKAATLLPRAGQQTGAARPAPGPRPPLNVALLDLLDDRPKLNGRTLDPAESAALDAYIGQRRQGVLPCLSAWVTLAEGDAWESGQTVAASASSATVQTEAGWLLDHLSFVARRPWAADFDADIRRMWRDLRQAAGERDSYRPRCPECRARLDDRGGFYACPRCGRDYRDERMASCDEPMTARRIAALFDLNVKTIRTWANRGELAPACDELGAHGAPLYWVDDVLRLADAMPDTVNKR